MADGFEFNIHCPGSGDGTPAVDAPLRRVNLIMGANGIGKSKLLFWLAANSSTVFPGYQPIYVEDSRIMINFPIDFRIEGPLLGILDDAQSYLENKYLPSRTGGLHIRLHSVLPLLRELERKEKIDHSDQVVKWNKLGKIGPLPELPRSPLEQLFTTFTSIFPAIKLFVTEGNQLYCRQTGQAHAYPVPALSQGEKQVLATIADALLLTREPSVFLIDEPELNLHATLADKLWSILEERFSKSIFVYATHSLTFAARSSIERAVILRIPPAAPVIVDRVMGQGGGGLEPFLGPLPAVLAYRKCLLTEGTTESIDQIFYTRLMAESELGVVPVGSASEVLAAVERQEVWKNIASEANIVGVIDHDFKDDDEIKRAEGIRMYSLRFARNRMLPLRSYSNRRNIATLGTLKTPITADQILEELISFGKGTIIRVAARRIFQRINSATPTQRLSLSREALSRISTCEQLCSELLRLAGNLRQEYPKNLDDTKIRRIVREEYIRCEEAIQKGDATAILRLFEGKEFLERVVLGRLELSSQTALTRAVFTHLDMEKHPKLQQLRDRIRSKLPNGN